MLVPVSECNRLLADVQLLAFRLGCCHRGDVEAGVLCGKYEAQQIEGDK
jgi:hypothetical protein